MGYFCRACREGDASTPQNRDDAYEEREVAWEASPDYDELTERGDDVAEEEGEWEVWLEEGCRPIPNRG